MTAERIPPPKLNPNDPGFRLPDFRYQVSAALALGRCGVVAAAVVFGGTVVVVGAADLVRVV